MKYSIAKSVIAIVLVLSTVSFGIKYSGGSGTEADPYKIASKADLLALGANTGDYDKCFIMTADIDLSGNTFTQAVIAPDTNNTTDGGFQGKAFTGSFDGNGHVIRNLTITAPTIDYVGLFGKGRRIINLGMENVNITGRDSVGGLAGANDNIITSCYATGLVTGKRDVGGLVGYNYGILTSCYATSSVTATDTNAGGLVGYNYTDGALTSCYATGSVSGDSYVGGLAGENYGVLTSCYASGSVSGGLYVGGLVGEKSGGSITSCFWDKDTSGKNVGVGKGSTTGATGKTTAQMKTPSTFTSVGWDFVDENANGLNDYWQMLVNDYPRFPTHTWNLSGAGTSADPYVIATPAHLGKVWLKPSSYYRLSGNLDLTAISWSTAVVPTFTGDFDGNGFVISHLKINRLNSYYIGLFGYMDGRIKSLGIEDVNVLGGYYTGGLVGFNDNGTLTSCYATGSVSGKDNPYIGGLVGNNYNGTLTSCRASGSVTGKHDVGGLVGYNDYGTLTFCYATGSVNGASYVGGLAGYNGGGLTSCYASGSVSGDYSVGGLLGCNDGTLTSCYASGHVSGTTYVGGLVGWNSSDNTSTACFWDTQTSGQIVAVGDGESDGIYGKTTVLMKTLSTFTDAGWDFSATDGDPADWKIPTNDYPKLAWDNTVSPTVPSAPTDVLATDGTYTDKVTITWTAASGATAYDVYRFTSNNSASSTKINSSDITGTSYNDTSAVAGTTYWYWVKAKNTSGTSGFSNGDSGYRAATVTPPSAPTNLLATDGTYGDKVAITWTASSGATAYDVYRYASNNSASSAKINSSDVTATSYNDTSAVAGTTYWYWVKAKNTGGTSGFSNGDSGYRALPVLPAFTAQKCSVKAGNNNLDSISISGLLNAADGDFMAAMNGNVVVSVDSDLMPSPKTFTFQITPTNYKKGKFSGKNSNDTFSFDTKNQKFTFAAKNTDLTGVACPFTVTITIGSYAAQAELGETIVNGTKPIPFQLMMGVQNKLEITKSKLKPGKIALTNTDTLTAQGIFTIDGIFDVTKKFVITIGSQSFTVPENSFVPKNGSFSCKNIPVAGGFVTAKLDTNKCTFTLSITKANITKAGEVKFELDCFGNNLKGLETINLN